MIFDFVIPKRPVSFQTSNNKNLTAWKNYVYGYAFREWRGRPVTDKAFRFTVVYLCDENPPDINNIIKPIEDVLCGLVYPDDNSVIDVDGHTRYLSDGISIIELPEKTARSVL